MLTTAAATTTRRAREHRASSASKLIVAWTEHQIQSYLTTQRLDSGTPANPANVAAAIRKLRAALKPFVEGWVDYETAEIIHGDLDVRLAHRE